MAVGGFVSYCIMYMSQIDKKYLSQIVKCICPEYQVRAAGLEGCFCNWRLVFRWQLVDLSQIVFVSNCKMYLSQISGKSRRRGVFLQREAVG